MPRFKWIYLEGDGVKHHVELFHGRMKGHVLISCNGSILVTDFDVRQSKTYTFFINEELCKIHMNRKGLKFTYSFEIDKKTNTPLNQLRRKRQSRYNIYLGLMVLGFAIFCSLFIAFNRKVKIEQTGLDPWLAYAVPSPESDTLYFGGITYSLDDQLQMYSIIDSNIYSKNLDGYIAINGWPFEVGQEYAVRLRDGGLIIDWHKPSDKTLTFIMIPEELSLKVFKKSSFEQPKEFFPPSI